MSNERKPTGGEGEATGDGSSVSDEQVTSSTDIDALFEVLADEQRREVLSYLDATDDDVAEFSNLVEHVVDSVGDPSADRERVAVGLHHTHLPKLSDAGIVEYDSRSETLRYRGGQLVADWLELASKYDSDGPKLEVNI